MRTTEIRRRRLAALLLAILLSGRCADPELLAQQAGEVPTAVPARTDPGASHESGHRADTGTPEDEDHERERIATVGITLVVIVGLCGGLLLLFVVAGGRYVRRIVQKPLPATTPRDELWYLKTRSRLDAPAGDLRPEREDSPPGTEPPGDRNEPA